MKIIFAENLIDYNNYKFSYSVNSILDDKDSIENCFSKGFLPFTGDTNNTNEIYYLARSVRVNLKDYERLSENNRVIKNAKNKYNIDFKSYEKNALILNEDFIDFCISFSKERFSNNTLTKDRLQLIFSRKNFNNIYTFSIDKKVIGYVLWYENENIIHYWFSFYDTNYLKEFPIGKYMMEHLVYYAKENNKKYIYLGTCYGKKALYKVRDFKGIEFYDGNNWVNDIRILKNKCKSDLIE